MPKIIQISIVILSLIALWILVNVLGRPNLKKIESERVNEDAISETSYRNNYEELVKKDALNGETFLRSEIAYSKLFENNFPFRSEQLESEITEELVNIFNDSSSYSWGEYGTPEHQRTIVYYGKIDDPIGYTQIDEMGEVENYPYRSLMKWGRLSESGFRKLEAALKPK